MICDFNKEELDVVRDSKIKAEVRKKQRTR
jgi:hypothetical protein